MSDPLALQGRRGIAIPMARETSTVPGC